MFIIFFSFDLNNNNHGWENYGIKLVNIVIHIIHFDLYLVLQGNLREL